jgi:serine/threonine protein kinase
MTAMYHMVQDEHPPLPEGISEDMKDFLMRCFKRDTKERATAAQLSAHPWYVCLFAFALEFVFILITCFLLFILSY